MENYNYNDLSNVVKTLVSTSVAINPDDLTQNSLVDYDVNVAPNEILLSDSVEMQGKITCRTYNAGNLLGAPVAGNNLWWNSNPMAGVFTDVIYGAVGKDISKCNNNNGMTDTAIKRLFNSGDVLSDGLDFNTSAMSDAQRKAAFLADGGIRTFNWKPDALGVCQLKNLGLGVGKHTFTFKTDPNYRLNVVTTDAAATVPAVGAATVEHTYVITVELKLFVKTGIIPYERDGSMSFNFIDTEVRSANFTGDSVMDFVIPKTAIACTVLFQTTDIQNNRVPFNTFRSGTAGAGPGNEIDTIKAIQVKYAGILQPSSTYDCSGGTKNLRTLYKDSYFASNLLRLDRSPESLLDFHDRGALWHFSLATDSDNKSTQLSVTINGTVSTPGSLRIYVISHFTNACVMTYKNGQITQVDVERI